VIDYVQSLWLRAKRAADVRGIISKSKSLTPKEIADDVALRGDDRLARLVDGWYYPKSYGHVPGSLSEEEVKRIVASLEADAVRPEVAAPKTEDAVVEAPPPPRPALCECCGFPLTRGTF
jgi:hypothetical protein